MTLTRPQVVGGLLTAVVLAVVATGIVLLGFPEEERARRLDERRVRDLVDLARAVDVYWTRHESLPPSLGELEKEPGATVRSTDPRTNDLYEYRPLEARTYEVCASFERDLGDDTFGGDGFWAHGSGRQCFRREARKVS